MAEYMTLLGADDVRRGASEMASAADKIRGAAGDFDSAVRQQQINLSDFMIQFNEAIDRLAVVLATNGKGE